MTIETAIAVLLGLVFLALLFVAASLRAAARGRDVEGLVASHDALRAELASRLDANTESVNSRISALSGEVADRLGTIAGQMQAHGGELNRRMDNASGLFSALTRDLGELKQSSERIFEVGRDISGLHDILRSPKSRGGFGELMLAELLAACLPPACFSLQHGFSTGARVDAVVRLSGRLVPVDAKFPLENFRKVFEVEPGAARDSARRRFLADCRKHVDAIAGSYILPEEGTMSFALMYIPAENVYYEAVLSEEGSAGALMDYALGKRVVPVSPAGFYAYLQTILVGLRGMEVSEKAGEIMDRLEGLAREFSAFSADFDTLGRHLTNSRGKYEEVMRAMARFGDRLGTLTGLGGGEGGPEEGAGRD